MNAQPVLLDVSEVVVDYAVRASEGRHGGRLKAVRGVSFQLAAGEIFGLAGESGCGKTSLARAIMGLVPLAEGSIHLRGEVLAGPGAPSAYRPRREIQYLFQDASAALSPRRSILQTLQEPLALYDMDKRGGRRTGPAGDQGSDRRADYAARIERALEAVHLQADVLPRYPHQLSGGQRQRVALARALLAEPAIIIADEPMSSQDVSVQAHLIALLRDLRAQMGIAILLISHDLAVVQQLADRVGIMYLGEMMEAGPAASVLRQPAHPYTRALLAAVVQRPCAAPAPSRLGVTCGDGLESTALQGEPPSALTPPAGCVFHNRCPELIERCRGQRPATTDFRAESGQLHTVRCHLCQSHAHDPWTSGP